MSAVEPIASIAADQLAALLPASGAMGAMGAGQGQAVAAGNFGQLVSQGLAQVNEQLLTSQVDLQRLATGDVQNLHQVMIRLEESRLSFQLMMQVRGRLLEAYQDIMKMQV